MSDKTKEDSLTEVFTVRWPDLRREFAFGRLYFLDSSLDIKTAANTMAQDNKTVVQSWLKDAKLKAVTEEQVSEWEEDLELEFLMMIVSPFVLIQLKSH